MRVPIYIDDRQEGELTVERQGAMTVMDARLRDMGRLVRLSVFGEREAYLGVPAPSEGELRLVRRLSPNEMRRFPEHPEYAAESRRKIDKTPPAPKETAPPERGKHVLWQGGRPYYF